MKPHHIDYVQHAARAAQHGSPGLVAAIGRLYGLGQAERDALAGGRIPGWAWAVLGMGAGVVIGVRVYRKWPRKVPKLIAGG